GRVEDLVELRVDELVDVLDEVLDLLLVEPLLVLVEVVDDGGEAGDEALLVRHVVDDRLQVLLEHRGRLRDLRLLGLEPHAGDEALQAEFGGGIGCHGVGSSLSRVLSVQRAVDQSAEGASFAPGGTLNSSNPWRSAKSAFA